MKRCFKILFHDKYLTNKFVKTTVIDALFYFIINLYVNFFSPYLETLGWSEPLKGIFFALFSIWGILLAPFIGTLSDKVGRFKVIIAGIVIEIFALIGYSFFTSTAVLFFTRILSAIAFNSVVISALARINDTITNNNTRTKTTGLFQSIVSISIVVAPLIGGFIADNYGYIEIFKMALYLMIIILLIILVLDFFIYDDNHPHKQKQKVQLQDFNIFTNLKKAMQYKEMRTITILGSFVNLTSSFIFLTLPFFIIKRMNLTNSHLSVAIFLIGIAHVFQFILGSISDKIGKSKGIIIGLTIAAITFFLMFYSKTYETLLLLTLLNALGMSLWNVSAWSYMSDIGEKYNIEGKIIGSYTSIARISITISHILSGVILALFNIQIFYIYTIVIIIPLIMLSKTILKSKTD